jgi:8-oxo-dGTP pyrophosphatase MutT (NUDIX family)
MTEFVPPRVPAFDPRHAPLEPVEPLPPLEPERLTAAALRARFAAPPADWAPESTGDRIRVPGREGAAVAAAVLVPIVLHEAPTVLLTQRTAHLSSHAGQVAFPGGRADPEDASLERTALREAEEEIGLPPSRVELIGRLPDYLTGTNYRVTPVVGLVEPGFALRLSPREVAAAFEVPLSWLMDPAGHRRHRLALGDNASRAFWSMPWTADHGGEAREFFIWGATAAMLRNLYRFLAA